MDNLVSPINLNACLEWLEQTEAQTQDEHATTPLKRL